MLNKETQRRRHQGGGPLPWVGSLYLDQEEMNAGDQVDFNFLFVLALQVAAHILGCASVILLLTL